MLLVTAEEMRALDRETIDVLGVPGAVLMESAGRGVVEVVARLYEVRGRRAVIFCGPGNNGGDGFVIARHLCHRGADVIVGLVGERGQFRGDAKIHFDALEKERVQIVPAGEAPLHRRDLIVDAVFGTGLARPVGPGPARDAIARMRAHRGPVVAVDVPSGLSADRGLLPGGLCVRADHTVTFAFAKLGLVGADALDVVGELHVVDIGIPEARAKQRGVKAELLEPAVLASWRVRPAGGHKGTHGHVLVVAGARGKTGAALLAGVGVLRSGAGLCTVAMPEDAAALVEGRVPELMIAALGAHPPPSPKGRPHADGLRPFTDLFANKDAAAVGPGIARDDAARERIRALVRSELPLVVDADALNLVAAEPALLPARSSATVMTPHPGEAGRLLGRSTADITADRVRSAQLLAERYGAVAVLKGARTVIASPDGRLAINPTGNPGLGTAGTGDVLTGCVAAALARQAGSGAPVDGFAAACAAVYWHGAAGDLAAAKRSQVGLLASDVLDALPLVFAPR